MLGHLSASLRLSSLRTAAVLGGEFEYHWDVKAGVSFLFANKCSPNNTRFVLSIEMVK